MSSDGSSTSYSTAGTDDRFGWTSSPNGRGTMSIIWSCAVTTFLCCWSVLVINLQKPGSSRWSNIRRKLLLVGLTAVAPEIVFQIALGQWLSARDSTKLFHASGYSQWTLRHSFFVDMGGMHLRCRDHSPFPINSRQLHYMIMKEYVAYPSIDESQIRDRNKVDGTLRLITLIQTLFFMINLLIRAIQGLEITALELSTAAFVVVSILTTVFWLFKPADVERCDFIEAEVPLATILQNENVPDDAIYTYTPMDFVGREEWSWSILWMHGLSCLRKLHLAGQPRQLPVQRVQNTIVPAIRGWFLTLFAVVSLVYFGIFIAAWNHGFATTIELVLWRTASLTAMVSALGAFFTQQVFFEWIPSLRRSSIQVDTSTKAGEDSTHKQGEGSTKKQSTRTKYLKARFDAILATLRNNSTTRDPAFDAPIGAVVLTWFFGIFYVSARIYIMVADLVELRLLRASAYETLDWSSLAPYVP